MKLESGKVALITGGNSGIGKACAKLFSSHGATVIITARREKEGFETVDEIQKAGGHCEFFKCDLTNHLEIKALFELIHEKHKRIDYAVNNAGIEGKSFTRLTDYPEEVWDEVMTVNLKSVWLCLKYEITQMLKQNNGGAIVNVSSTAGLRASYSGGCAYTASKHALVGLTKTAAIEYAKEKVRVNVVCPAFVHTPMAEAVMQDKLQDVAKIHPLNRLCQPEEVANAVYWLCSNSASFITGTALPVDGGVMA